MGETTTRITGIIHKNVTATESLTLPCEAEGASDAYSKENGVKLRVALDGRKRLEYKQGGAWNPLFFYTFHKQIVVNDGAEITPTSTAYQSDDLIGRSIEIMLDGLYLHRGLLDRFSYTHDPATGIASFTAAVGGPVEGLPKVIAIFVYPYAQDVPAPGVFGFAEQPAGAEVAPGADFSLTYIVQNGVGPYVYTWHNITSGEDITGNTVDNTNTLTTATAVDAQYQVDVKDANDNLITSDVVNVTVAVASLKAVTSGYSTASPFDDYDTPPGLFNPLAQGNQNPAGDITVTFQAEADYTYLVVKVAGTYEPRKLFFFFNNDNKGAIGEAAGQGWLDAYVADGDTYYVSSERLIIPLGTSLVLKSSL